MDQLESCVILKNMKNSLNFQRKHIKIVDIMKKIRLLEQVSK